MMGADCLEWGDQDVKKPALGALQHACTLRLQVCACVLLLKLWPVF
jgi:hypothetical protein